MQTKRETRHCEGAARGNPVNFTAAKLVHTSGYGIATSGYALLAMTQKLRE